MRPGTMLITAAMFCVALTIAREVGLDSEPAHGATQTPASGPTSQPDNETLIATFVRHAMPGTQHRLLQRMAGQWKLKVRYKMTADAPPVESEGTCTRKWILGGRFLLEEFDGGSLAVPFQGLALYGYDTFEKKYTSIWVDTTSTAITTSLGICADDCRRIQFAGRHGDPWSGTKRASRGETRFVSDAEHVLELYETGADGREYRVLDITYTRAD